MSKKKMQKSANELIELAESWAPKNWYALDSFSQAGQASGYFLKNVLKLESDPSGIYVLRAKNLSDFYSTTGLSITKKLFYVGRAGEIARRLNRHLKVEKHNSASLVYKLTAQSLDRTSVRRAKNMENKKFREAFRANQSYLRDECEVSFLEVENDERQAIVEILLSLRFATPFNEWKTH